MFVDFVGPRLKPRILTDDEGTYTIWTGKTCERCSVQLTSRNRSGKKLLCIEHGREWYRERYADRTSRPKKPKSYSLDPARQKVHAALAHWLSTPTDPLAAEQLRSLMTDHELQHRLKLVLSR